MEELYIVLIFIEILILFLVIVLELKRMVYLRSLKKIESRNAKLFVYYSNCHMKYEFKKNGDGRHFRFSVNGEILNQA